MSPKGVLQGVLQECLTRATIKSARQECPTRVSRKGVPQERPKRLPYTRVSHKSILQDYKRVFQERVPQECPAGVSIIQECPARVSLQECLTRVSDKGVLQELPTREPHKSVLQECCARAFHKSECDTRCPTRVHKSVPPRLPKNMCPTRVSHTSVSKSVKNCLGACV